MNGISTMVICLGLFGLLGFFVVFFLVGFFFELPVHLELTSQKETFEDG